jgi:hypothetical protein
VDPLKPSAGKAGSIYFSPLGFFSVSWFATVNVPCYKVQDEIMFEDSLQTATGHTRKIAGWSKGETQGGRWNWGAEG